MDDLKIVGRQNDGFDTPLGYKVLPGGVLPTADWIMQLIMRGFGWHFSIGSDITPITGGGAGTVFDLEQPEGIVSIPAGWTMVPFDINVDVQPGLQTTDSHVVDIILSVDRSQAWNGTGTATTETPNNLRTDIAAGCPLTVRSAFTADVTTITLAPTMDLARWSGKTDFQGTPADSIIRTAQVRYAPARPPLVVGPAMMLLYFCGSIAVVGYASFNFLAVPSALLTGIS